MVVWYFVFYAFIPGYTAINTVGPFPTKEAREQQRKIVTDLATERLVMNGYIHAKDKIPKDMRTWGCYHIPESPKKRAE